MTSGAESQSLGFAMSIVWALFVASAFPIGALISTYVKIPRKIQADLAAFSAGIFIGAIAFSLVDDALKVGESPDLLIGFVVGAITFSLADYVIKRKAKEEKKDESKPNDKNEMKKLGGKAQSVVLGTIVDSTPETILIATIIALPLTGLVPSAVALFLGNIAAAIEGTKRLYDRGGKKRIVLAGWAIVFVVVFAAGPIGYYLVQQLSGDHISTIIGFAAGALMAFVTQELIPKAFERRSVYIGLSVVAGFLIAFALFHYI